MSFSAFKRDTRLSRLIDVAKDDGLRGAGLLARGPNFTVADRPVLVAGADLGFANALHAVSALLHHAAAAHGDVGVALQLDRFRHPVLKQEEIEAAHLIRAVIGAVTGADAAVVNHVIQAVAAVICGLHRADQFAGSVLALHAGHRLIVEARGYRGRPCSKCRSGSSASRAAAALLPSPRRECCSRPGRRPRTRCSSRTP